MESGVTNTYHLSCQVVEVIRREEKRIIKAVCKPGSLIIEIPDDGKARLGDRVLIKGVIHIDTLIVENSRENHN